MLHYHRLGPIFDAASCDSLALLNSRRLSICSSSVGYLGPKLLISLYYDQYLHCLTSANGIGLRLIVIAYA